jgi:hypothetical protein
MSKPNKLIKVMEKIPLEDYDLKKILGSGIKIITYKELAPIMDITELLPNSNSEVVLLYEQEKNTGHWACLKRINNNIYYFQSYGGDIDEPLKWSKDNNEMLGQTQPFLLNLLLKSPLNVYYNDYSFQNIKNPNITTCGLWCAVFLKSNLSLQEFLKRFLKLKKKSKLSNDELITKIMIDKTLNLTHP